MSRSADNFNRSGLSRFLNSPGGRLFRLAMGAGFLAIGYIYRSHTLGVLSMAVHGVGRFSAERRGF